jgi:hypothetical protein
MVVTSAYALAMATVNGQPVQSKMPLAAAQPYSLRAELATITNALSAKHYGPVDPTR